MIVLKAWYWLALGMILIMAELVVPSFTIIWFGCGAFVVAVLLWLFNGISVNLQLFIWALASIVFTAAWFLILKPRMFDKTKAGIPLEAALGSSGLVVRVPGESHRGMVKFAPPLLGAEEWQFICEDTVAVGDRVSVTDVSGNTLIVTKK
ncbi:MAG: NfeD family protein [Pseudomonadota bacterium]